MNGESKGGQCGGSVTTEGSVPSSTYPAPSMLFAAVKTAYTTTNNKLLLQRMRHSQPSPSPPLSSPARPVTLYSSPPLSFNQQTLELFLSCVYP